MSKISIGEKAIALGCISGKLMLENAKTGLHELKTSKDKKRRELYEIKKKELVKLTHAYNAMFGGIYRSIPKEQASQFEEDMESLLDASWSG